MIPVDQTTFGGPEADPPGNCTSACVASLLGLPIDQVPFFVKGHWFQRLARFAAEHGHVAVYLRGDPYTAGDGVSALFPPGGKFGWMLPSGTLCIAGGPGPRGHGHSVVWRIGQGMVHDPHPSRAGLAGEPEDFILLLPSPDAGRVRQPPVWTPVTGMQKHLLTCEADEILLGGPRGSGKTDACLGDWLAYADRYGMNAHGVWYVQTMPEFLAVEDRMAFLFAAQGATRARPSKWTWPSGATLCLRILSRKEHVERDAGREFTWACVDNAGRWLRPRLVDAVIGFMRSPDGVPLRVLFTTVEDPDWLKERFGRDARPLEPVVADKVRVVLPASPAYYEKDPGGPA